MTNINVDCVYILKYVQLHY